MIIKDVTSYQSFNNHIYWIDINGNLHKNDEKEKILTTEAHADLFWVNDMLFVRSSVNGSLLLTYPTSIISYKKRITKIEKAIVYYYEGKFMDKTYGISQLNIDNTITDLYQTKEFRIIKKYDEFVVGINENTLFFNRISNATSLWQFPLSSLDNKIFAVNEPDELNKILGVAHGNLWFSTKGYKLVALDVNTGKVIYENEGFGLTFDTLTQNIFSLSSNIITIINTKTLLVEESYNYLEADPSGIGKYQHIFSPLLQGKYFTFIAEKKEDYGGSRRVGIFDYTLRKLIWEHEVFSQEEMNMCKNKLVPTNPLFMSGNKLYIKDFKNNLHIFEKELVPARTKWD
jgi:hypothetical protein